MPESPDLDQFPEYHYVSEQLIANATKTELVECARLLALEVAHYQAKYGESLLEQAIFTATNEDPDPATAKLLNEGVQNFVGVLAMLKGYEVDTGKLSHSYASRCRSCAGWYHLCRQGGLHRGWRHAHNFGRSEYEQG